MSENVNGTGQAKSNYEGSQESVLDHARALAKQALLDLATGDKKGIDGTAGLRMGGSVFYQFEAFKMGSPKPRDISDYLTSKATRDAVTPLYVNHLIGPMPANPRGEAAKLPGAKVYPANVLHDMQVAWRRNRQLVVRGLELASVIVKLSIPMDEKTFNEKTGALTLPKAAFLKAGFVCKDDAILTQIGGTTFFGQKQVAGKNTELDKIKPSLTRLIQAHKATAPRNVDAGTPGTPGNTEQSRAEAAGLNENIATLHRILNSKNSDKGWTPRKSDFGDKTWNMLSDIARWVNEWSATETFFVKPKATPKAEPKNDEKAAA